MVAQGLRAYGRIHETTSFDGRLRNRDRTVIASLWRFTSINGVLAFWLVYITTRPLGASTGDFLSQKGNQGLNLGTSGTSYAFLAVIVFLVLYLQIRKPDVTPPELAGADAINHPHLPHPHLPHPHLRRSHLPHPPVERRTAQEEA
jgi:hypothetical protein